MFFKRIETPGLAHWSYMIGDGSEIVVIDPRRDVGIYLEEARKARMNITAILETHRNEDYIIGSRELAELTGAAVYISGYEDLGFNYGTFIQDYDTIRLGSLTIQALHTPGHTLGHMSYAVYIKDQPYMVFTGDCLFAGDVGRTDFYGKENLPKMTGLLYESIMEKIFPLGDHVLLCPAHGAGSACGTAIQDRPWTTVGYERHFNPRLQYATKEDFINNVGQVLPKPPYFEKMEVCNVKGAPFLGDIVKLPAIRVSSLPKSLSEGQIVDVRDEGAFCTSHIPNSLYIPKGSLASYLGWFVDVETPIYFLTNEFSEASLTFLYMTCRRTGFDNTAGFLGSGIIEWETRGGEINSIETVSPADLKQRLSASRDIVILDVRKNEELARARSLDNSIHIPLHDLKVRAQELPDNRPIYILCASGVRSTIAASILKMAGKKPAVILGGLVGWHAAKQSDN